MKKLAMSIIFLTMLAFVICASNPPAKSNPGKPIYLNKKTFLEKVFNYKENSKEWKYEGDKPAIIDFYATWCGPCKKVAPVLDKLAKQYQDELYIYKIDVDKEPELANTFGIKSIPTFFFIPMEGKPQLGQGALPEKSFLKVINEFLLPQKNMKLNDNQCK